MGAYAQLGIYHTPLLRHFEGLLRSPEVLQPMGIMSIASVLHNLAALRYTNGKLLGSLSWRRCTIKRTRAKLYY